MQHLLRLTEYQLSRGFRMDFGENMGWIPRGRTAALLRPSGARGKAAAPPALRIDGDICSPDNKLISSTRVQTATFVVVTGRES